MTDKSVSVSEWVIFIANISVIEISVILHIGAPLVKIRENLEIFVPRKFPAIRYMPKMLFSNNITL